MAMTPASRVGVLADVHRAMIAFVERRVGDRATAEDLVQEAWAKAEVKEEDVPAKAWMYRVLRNAIIDRSRRLGTQARGLAAFASELEATGADVMSTDLDNMVCQCIGQLAKTLPADQAEALARIELDGLAVKEYAEEAGITASNAGVRVFRARVALRKRVVEACGICAQHGCADCSCGH